MIIIIKINNKNKVKVYINMKKFLSSNKEVDKK